jgi:hypothetical protein
MAGTDAGGHKRMRAAHHPRLPILQALILQMLILNATASHSHNWNRTQLTDTAGLPHQRHSGSGGMANTICLCCHTMVIAQVGLTSG